MRDDSGGDIIHLTRRIARLEKIAAPMRENRILLRFEGPGSESLAQPTKEDIDSAAQVMTIRFVAATEGRPAEWP